MHVVLGQIGSGTKWVATTLAWAIQGSGEFRDEPLSLGPYRRYLEGVDSEETWNTVFAAHARRMTGGNWCVLKDHFWIPGYMRGVGCSVYVVRRTVANVHYLLQWGRVGETGYGWYFRAALRRNPDATLALWPSGVPTDDLVATLAVSHQIRVAHDLRVARELGIPVWRGEELMGDYVSLWPMLLETLGIEPHPNFEQYLQRNASPTYFPLEKDRGFLRKVIEVEKRAADLDWSAVLGAPV